MSLGDILFPFPCARRILRSSRDTSQVLTTALSILPCVTEMTIDYRSLGQKNTIGLPGYDHILGHEFVGIVEACTAKPELEGRRVVGEINCPCSNAEIHPDPIFQRNHSPGRTVLGIIGKNVSAHSTFIACVPVPLRTRVVLKCLLRVQGTLAEYLTLPASNLHLVPDFTTDQEACFAEPLAAACRITEQQVSSSST